MLKSVPDVVEVNWWGGDRRTWDVIADSTRALANLDDLVQRLRQARGGVGAAADAQAGAAALASAREEFEAARSPEAAARFFSLMDKSADGVITLKDLQRS